ncbi:MAG: hypothetical protein JNM93_07255 [Bacteriovoracaceae bacterium]|nr:hypothetical protein [Bacteriovoracaceae bacterium]
MRRISLSFLLLLSLLVSCGPAPLTKMTELERVADMYWLISVYEQNYAPMEYKAQVAGLTYEETKAKYLEQAKKDQENDAFFLLMHKYIAEFKDAHASGSLTPANYPGVHQVAYLGFKGERTGDTFKVTELMPTFKGKSDFEIKIGDEIVSVNGKSLKQIVDEELLSYRNLGQAEANYTYHMGNIFLRSSTSLPLPKDEFVTVKLIREKITLERTLKWIKKDRLEFIEEQQKALAAETPEKKNVQFYLTDLMNKQLDFNGNIKESIKKIEDAGAWKTVFQDRSILNLFKDVNSLEMILGVELDSHFSAEKTYEFFNDRFDWFVGNSERLRAASTDRFSKARNSFSGRKIYLTKDGKSVEPTYPAYIKEEVVLGLTNKVGYIFLDTFSPPALATVAVEDVKLTLEEFRYLGVSNIVIDMINNGGGSLALGAQIAQLFSDTKIAMPTLRYRLSDDWLRDFISMSEDSAANDSVRSYSEYYLKQLWEDKNMGQWLSRPMPLESLFPYAFEVDGKTRSKFNVLLLVNEMCASMCDIFTGIMKDNKLAKVMGVQTMGAGGNVVMHGAAPRSQFLVRTTESLIIRSNGEYIENNGVKPDFEVSVNADAAGKYSAIIAQAFQKVLATELSIQPILTEPEVAPEIATAGN